MKIQNPNNKKYDLEERTAKFGEDIIEFAKSIQKNPVTLPIISQLIKAGTSIGANYCEADCAETKKDFIHKLGICKKESKETRYWFRMVVEADSNKKEEARRNWQEANELNLIFSSIVNKTKANLDFKHW